MKPPIKPRFAHQAALAVAQEIVTILRPVCERIIIAGSLRREKPWVGDVEILYISREMTGNTLGDFFAQETRRLAEDRINSMLFDGLLTKRLNSAGTQMWGDLNKLAVHTATGIPVDLFRTTEFCWFNNLVCRTGSAAHNITIATRAQQLGWRWSVYGSGFINSSATASHDVTSEDDLFDFLKMDFKAPKDR
jgi:DNA polymerase/3'-5' exonuclease PolX